MVASGSRRSTYVYGLLVYVLHVISVHVLNGFIQYTYTTYAMRLYIFFN